jgi:hypothetical protein
MKSRCQELIQIGDALYSKRFPLLTLYQTFAENFAPMFADFTRIRYLSEEFASYLMTSRPALCHRELSDAISSILRPAGMQWFKAKTGQDSIDEDKPSKEWLEWSDGVMRRVMYDRASQFSRATKEADQFYILTGNAVIEPRMNKARNGVLFTTWHLRDCVWQMNAEQVIDQFHRKWKTDIRALTRLYRDNPQASIHPEVMKRVEKDPLTEINCRVIILPTDEYDSYGKDEKGRPARKGAHPFIRIVIDEDNQHIIEEVPQWDLGHVIPRWHVIKGFAQYAYSPTAILALPDARMLQQMTLTLIEIGEKITDPPMIAVGDAIQGGTNLYSGAITWVDPDYDERTGEVLRPIPLEFRGLEWGKDYEDCIEKVLQETFYLNVLNLPPADVKEMTAYEVSERMKEYIRRATPLFEPLNTDYNGQLCDFTRNMLERVGAFGSMFDRPQALRGQRIEYKFANPLVQAEDEMKTVAFQKMGQLLAAAMEFDPNVKAHVRVTPAFRDAYVGTGAPAKWLEDKDKADAIVAHAEQQQAMAQQAADLGHAAEQGGKVATAVQNVGDAATSLQNAGLAQ